MFCKGLSIFLGRHLERRTAFTRAAAIALVLKPDAGRRGRASASRARCSDRAADACAVSASDDRKLSVATYLDEMRRPVSKRDAFVTKLPSALEVQ